MFAVDPMHGLLLGVGTRLLRFVVGSHTAMLRSFPFDKPKNANKRKTKEVVARSAFKKSEVSLIAYWIDNVHVPLGRLVFPKILEFKYSGMWCVCESRTGTSTLVLY